MTANKKPSEDILFQFKKAIKGKENSISSSDSTKIIEKHIEEGQRKSRADHTETTHSDHHTDCYEAVNKCLK
ncbi:MAG: hypothetical protein JSR17_06930 [Proteobacteria bacterium]|nr:hypothetical protein [Pseudomonadota bacterium]